MASGYECWEGLGHIADGLEWSVDLGLSDGIFTGLQGHGTVPGWMLVVKVLTDLGVISMGWCHRSKDGETWENGASK